MKYFSVFIITLIVSVILFFIFGAVYSGVDASVNVYGSIIILLLCFLITLVYRLIDLVKQR